MSTEVIYWILAGIVYLTGLLFYIRRKINEIKQIDKTLRTNLHYDIKPNHAGTKVYQLRPAIELRDRQLNNLAGK